MRSANIIARAAVMGLMLVAGTAVATDWPQWRGVNRDGKTQLTAPAAWPKELAQKWKVTTGASDATPALVGDKLFVFYRRGAAEVTQCLNAADGKPVWVDSYEPGVTVSGPAGPHPGPRASPAVAEGKVVTLGVSGVLSCLDAATGKPAWRRESAKDFPKGWPKFYTSSSPLIVEGMCIAQLGGEGKGAVAALDLANGQPKWMAEGDGPAYASPVVTSVEGVKMLIAQTDKNLMGLTLADGKVLWKVATPAQRMAQNAVSPVADGGIVYYSGQGSGTRAIAVEKQGDAYVTKELWANPQISSTFSTPVLKDNLLFGLSDKGNFYCLDSKSGKTLWTSSDKHGERGFGSVVDAGSVLVGLTSKGEMVVFKPSEKAYEAATTYKVSDALVYGGPVIAGDRVFVQDQQGLTAWGVE